MGIIWAQISQAYFHQFGVFNLNILGVNIGHKDITVGKASQLLTVKNEGLSLTLLLWTEMIHNFYHTKMLSSYRQMSTAHPTCKSKSKLFSF